MSELTLKRAIMLDSGEIIPAGSVLKNYGEFTPKSISPSLIASGQVHFRGKNKDTIRVLCYFKILWFWLAGIEESAMINKIPELLKQNLCVSGTIDASWLELRNQW